MSTWVFSCKLGLSQDGCFYYDHDPQSRGAGRWGGCPSCKYRKAANAETMNAEANYADKQEAAQNPT